MTNFIRLATLVVMASYPVASHAVLIAWDSFATSTRGDGYYRPGPIQGQDPYVDSGGFNSPWGGLYDTTGAFVATSGGLTHPLSPGTHAMGRIKPSENNYGFANRALSRAIDYSPVDGTYYMSVLLLKSAHGSSDLIAGLTPLESVHWSFSAMQGTYAGIAGDGAASGSISFMTTSTLDTVVPASEVHVGETYFTVMRFDYSTSGPDAATVTVYDGSSSMIADVTYAGLNLDGDIGRLGLLTSDLDPTAYIDEFRFGTELADVMVVAAPGDLNADGTVDGTDFLMWQRGESDPPLSQTDLTAWQQNYGTGANGAAASAPVPEPSTVVLVLTAALAVAWRRTT